jgi:hypothetical protein
MVGSV